MIRRHEAVPGRAHRQPPPACGPAGGPPRIRRRQSFRSGPSRRRGSLHPRRGGAPGARRPRGHHRGEYRRVIYFGHFPAAVSGFTEMDAEITFQDARGGAMTYRTPVVTGKLARRHGIATDEFEFVRGLTTRTPKVTLPSPCSQHAFRWREGVSERAYPDVEEFFADVAGIYRDELADLGARGATYVQLDDVSFPLLCDAKFRDGFRRRGHDPDAMVGRYVSLVNDALRDRPAGMTVGIHLCRGNNQGKWIGEGGYDAVAERIFTGLAVDAFFLEYDSPRAGSFAPLRFMPRDRHVVLGLVTSKTPALESADALAKRIDEASTTWRSLGMKR